MNIRPALTAIQLILHIIKGLIIITFSFPNKNCIQKNKAIQLWSEQLAAILQIRICVSGELRNYRPKNQMIVANHISWFDIFGINTIHAARFIAKSDVEEWPIINRLCKAAGTFFINRNKIRDAKRVNLQITEALLAGGITAFFPEGTTTNGKEINPFKTSLLQPAISSNGSIQPIYLNYTDRYNKHTAIAAYTQETTLLDSIWKIIRADGIKMHIDILPSIKTNNLSRTELSDLITTSVQNAHENFKSQYFDMHVKTVPEKFADLTNEQQTIAPPTQPQCLNQ